MTRFALVACAASVFAAPAYAQDARAQLDYVRSPGAEACPDDTALRAAVAARLGYVPFDEVAERTVRVRIDRRAASLRAVVEVLDRDGVVTGARELTSQAARGSCPLEDALVLAVSLAIDPMTLARVPEPEPPVEEPVVCPEPPPCPACAEPETPPPDAPDDPMRVRLSAALVGALAPEPSPTGGLRLGAGGRISAFSFDLELRGDVPTEGGDDEGRTATATWLSFAVVLCGHLDVLSLCGSMTIGALVGWGGGVDRPLTAITTFATAGARAGLEIAIGDGVALLVSIDGGVVLTPTTLEVDRRAIHVVPPLVGALAFGVIAEFL